MILVDGADGSEADLNKPIVSRSDAAGTSFQQSAINRVELVWPGKDKDYEPRQHADGQWVLEPAKQSRMLSPLVGLRYYPQLSKGDVSLVVTGDRIDSLHTLSRGLSQKVRLAYLDMPRIGVDDKVAAFRGDPTFAYSTWLSILRAHLEMLEPLLRRDGVVIIHTGDLEEPYARLVADEKFGPENRVATIVWQRAYGPRNMEGMKEFTATHDCLLVCCLAKATLPAVGLRTVPEGFANSDGDPRREWKAEHKGAHSRRERSNFNTYVPPYHWVLVKGRLPRGLWRLNPLTGVIWGVPEETGEFPLEIEAKDSEGKSAKKSLLLRCVEQGTPAKKPAIPWLFKEIKTNGKLRVATRTLPEAILGKEYSAICLAEGGVPFQDSPKRPGSGRYWEFADYTLLLAYQTDSVHLGKNGTAIPHPKAYLKEAAEMAIVNQMSWWPGRKQEGATTVSFAGYTEDATKHLKKLAEMGLVKKIVNTAKPEHLLARLIDIFTAPGDMVLEVFGEAADLSAVATKLGRRFVYLSGTSDRQRELLEACALPRLKAVVNGKDRDLETHKGEIRMRADAYLPYEGGGVFVACELGEPLFERNLRAEFPRLNLSYTEFDKLRDAVLTSQGFLPSPPGVVPDGRSLSGHTVAIVIPPDVYLDRERAAQIASTYRPEYDAIVIFYFRSTADFDPSLLGDGIVSRRVPSEITV
jgi:hypothetical protein